PTTTASPSEDCSARIPASFRSPTRTSFGHFRLAATPAAERTPAATATPVSSGSQPRADGGTEAGRNSTENVSDAPGWLTHVRPARPRPAVCSSATSTWPSRPPRARRAALVEPVLATILTDVHKPPPPLTASAS